MSEKRPIIIVKKVKKVSGGHHGGSWKVAYADFVTAMMAFFLVMWILGMDEQTREGIGEYFSNPLGVRAGMAAGMNPMLAGPPPGVQIIGTAGERERLQQLGEQIEARLNDAGFTDLEAHIEVTVTEEGLRIELIEGREGETFFASGSPRLQPQARRALEVISGELVRSTYDLVVEGHTDAAVFSSAQYTNWELSGDRANAARRALEDGGTITSPLVPWNTCGAYMAATLGVATLDYLPYAFFNLAGPVVALVMAYTGFRVLRLESGPEQSAPPEPASVPVGTRD